MLHSHTIVARDRIEGEIVDEIHLTYDDRHRRRIVLESLRGTRILLDLAKAVRLQNGDALATDEGLYRIVAAPEDLIEARCRTALEAARLAWHLGNRHIPTEIRVHALRFRADHVIEAMVQGLGVDTWAVHEPFEPEGGAYAQGGDHNHLHGEEHRGHHRD